MGVLEYQFPLFALHHYFHPALLGIYFLPISVPGHLSVISLHVDLELAPVVLHHVLALQLGGEGVGVLWKYLKIFENIKNI